MRRLLLAVLLCVATTAMAGEWKPLRIGAGGWVTQLAIADNAGTTVVVVGTDTRGAFLWDETAGEWIDIVNHSSMPSADVNEETSAGGYAVAIAPSDTTRLYLGFNGYYYVSSNSGTSWTRTDFPSKAMDANDQTSENRYSQQRCAVDPVDKDHVLASVGDEGTAGGMWRSTNGGTTFTELSALPLPSDAGVTGIVFDADSALVGGLTGTVFAGINGTGVYRSTDAGATWSVLSGGPSTVKHASVVGGIYYCTSVGDANNVWTWESGTGWTDVTPSVQNRSWHTILVDPNDTDRWVVSGQGAYFTQTANAGSTWSTIDFSDKTRVANDIPWLAWANDVYMAVGNMEWDPNVTDQVWFSEGIGVWTFSYPASPASPLVMTSHSKGIEQLIANDIVSPASGVVVTASWDKPLFYSDDQDVFPSTHGPDRDDDINHGWSVAVDPQDATRLVAVVNSGGDVFTKTGYSSDGGQTWTTFAASPYTDPYSGTAAVNGPDNVIQIETGSQPYYSTNNGVSWTAVTLPGAGWVGNYGDLHAQTYLKRRIFAADPGDEDTFYMFALHSSDSSLSGIYKTVNAGSTWTFVLNTEFGGSNLSYWNGKLKAVPGQTGHLAWTNGFVGGSTAGFLYYSDDGGASFSTFPDVLEAKDFAFGAAAPGESYPALAFAGWYDGVWGYWRTDDPTVASPTWVNIGTYPHDWLDHIAVMAGDPAIHNRWYIGWVGGGFSYYDPGGPGQMSRRMIGPLALPSKD